MGMGMKSLIWEGIGMKNLFPHISSTHGQTTCLLMLPSDTACTRFFLSPDRSSTSDIMGPWSYNYSSMNGTTLTSLLLEPVKQWMVTCKA